MQSYTKLQTTSLVILRITIGWHFLYEGLAKVLNPGWTSYPYLLDSQGLFAPLFKHLSSNPALLQISDFCTAWGLAIVGLCLILGLLTRLSIVGGMIFLFLFYISHPPCLDVSYVISSEGNYLWIDKNIIELCALFVLFVFPTDIGLDRFFKKNVKSVTS